MHIFEWSHDKSRRNAAKHGITFEQAARVFDDPDALMVLDHIVDGEERWHAIGRVGLHLVVVVAHTVREAGDIDIIRIVSARRALRYERQRYEDQAR